MAVSSTTGLVSNIDYNSLISQLVSLKRQSITDLNAEKKILSDRSSAYGTLNSKVADLISATNALTTSTSFNVFSTAVSDAAMLGATANSTATTGTYQVVISALAKAHKIAANGVASTTSLVGAGTFAFQVGTGAVNTITTTGATTLTDLQNSINGLNAGVTASIVNDGSAPNPNRLILTSNTTGASNGITITTNTTTLNFATTLQAAQNASFTVDGLAYTRSSNSVTDVISGVTLNLNAADALKTTTLTVNRDTTKIQQNIIALTDKYNAIVSYIQANSRYDTKTKTAGVFFGDSVARSVWDDLRRVMQSAISGLPSTMNRLVNIGVNSNSTTGQLSIDSAKLSTALASSFNDVVNLFIAGSTTNGFGKLVNDLANNINDYANGRITSRQKGISKNIISIDRDVANKEAAVSTYETQLRAQFAALENLLGKLKSQGNYLSGLGK